MFLFDRTYTPPEQWSASNTSYTLQLTSRLDPIPLQVGRSLLVRGNFFITSPSGILYSEFFLSLNDSPPTIIGPLTMGVSSFIVTIDADGNAVFDFGLSATPGSVLLTITELRLVGVK